MSEIPLLRTTEDIRLLELNLTSYEKMHYVTGIYIITNDTDEETLYVGQAKNIANRLSRHKTSGIYKPEEDKLRVAMIGDQRARDYIERRLIALLKPKYNKNRGNHKNTFDYDAMLFQEAANTRYVPYQGRDAMKENIDDNQIISQGVGLKKAEWDILDRTAKELSCTRHALVVWAIRDFMKRSEAGEITYVIKKSLPGLAP